MTDVASEDRTDPEHPVRHVVSRLEAIGDRDRATLGDLVGAFGPTAFTPALMIPAILVMSPLSGIPLFSSLCGLTIVLIAAQRLFGARKLWLPRTLTKRSVSGDRLGDAMRRTRRVADFLDRRTRRGRLEGLLGFAGRATLPLLCLIAGLLMPVLELAPFSSSILGASVLCFSIAMLTRDGLFALFGLPLLALAAAIPAGVISVV